MTDTTEGGTWGSIDHHQRYMIEASEHQVRGGCPWCPKRKRCTHLGMCNGVCLAVGCEWHMRQWVRDANPRKP